MTRDAPPIISYLYLIADVCTTERGKPLALFLGSIFCRALHAAAQKSAGLLDLVSVR